MIATEILSPKMNNEALAEYESNAAEQVPRRTYLRWVLGSAATVLILRRAVGP
jgi:hypothetical protein